MKPGRECQCHERRCTEHWNIAAELPHAGEHEQKGDQEQAGSDECGTHQRSDWRQGERGRYSENDDGAV